MFSLYVSIPKRGSEAVKQYKAQSLTIRCWAYKHLVSIPKRGSEAVKQKKPLI